MKSLTKKKFEEQGYAIVKNVLNFDNDLKPILNDMEVRDGSIDSQILS
jgi:ectoine hydroxylase-related dioxygenase (phytanoyl-CoA dioxygenase family)